MDIKTRKLVLIEEFLHIDDENLITKLENIIQQNKNAIHKQFLPMPLDEFHEMIDQALVDSKTGNVITHQELKQKVNEWK